MLAVPLSSRICSSFQIIIFEGSLQLTNIDFFSHMLWFWFSWLSKFGMGAYKWRSISKRRACFKSNIEGLHGAISTSSGLFFFLEGISLTCTACRLIWTLQFVLKAAKNMNVMSLNISWVLNDELQRLLFLEKIMIILLENIVPI